MTGPPDARTGARPPIPERAEYRVEAAPGRPLADDPSPFLVLTPRDRDLLRLLCTGSTNKEIAAVLYLADKTVRNQLSRLYAKLHVQRRSQAVAFAVRNGLDLDDG